ncbi:MAG TPA: DAK2 domain-containing protein [Tissierellaceae bacterium]|nr:DAK2 domain-containing protein [Tissierellaceae bacterium]
MKIQNLDGAMLKKALIGAAELLEDNKEEVNSLNVFPVPDGDTGTNMSLTVNSAIKQGLNQSSKSVSKIALATSNGSLMGARGNSGVILSQLFRGFANGLGDKDTVDIKTLSYAFKQAAETAYKAVMKPTEGTILTVARECGEYAVANYSKEDDILVFLKKIINHGEIILAKTPEMLPVLKEAGVVDAGGKGLIYVLKGAYNALSTEDDIFLSDKHELVEKKEVHEVASDEIEYGYCTEFIINTDYKDIHSLRQEFSLDTDSLMVVGGEGLIKVHVHTNNPGLILEKSLELGELSDIKIDNMRYQHEEILLKAELEELNNKKNNENIKNNIIDKKYSFIAISTGEGIDAIFKDLNVDVLVSGGQTMNPSTEDILNAIDNTTGEYVFILPNNSNIILAAEQSKELSSRNVIVIPTETIPQGISALISFNEEDSEEVNKNNMVETISYVKSGQVTYSVRDTEYNSTHIKKDDIIGLSDGDIVASGEDINIVAKELLEKMIDEDISLITILYGSDLPKDLAKELEEELSNNYNDIDIELIYGGQPLYYYIFSLE